MIKKSYGIGLIAVFLFLSACGGGGQTSDAGTQSLTSSTETSTTTDTGTVTDTGAVAPAGAGTISLKWVAPATRSDGDPLPLSAISGYTVYFGTSNGDYPYSIAVDDPSATALDIPDLPVGTYYLVMTTTDTQGLESAYSTVAVKEVTS